MNGPACRICQGPTRSVGTVEGRYKQRPFHVARCPGCGYGFIADPWLDYTSIYDNRYYAGEGADPLVDYHFELENPERSVRVYEWRGIAKRVDELGAGLDPSRRWLDYGAGNGGLVRHLRSHGLADAVGFDEGAIARDATAAGIPMVAADELPGLAGSFDVVTAIEVIEHTPDPIAELRRMRNLLKPGGLLFITTGNAAPYADRLTRWSYVIPEIHISFFEPRTLSMALEQAGLRPEFVPSGPGFDQILKFKVLKNLRLRRRSFLTDMVPARGMARIADRLTRLSEHPIGRAP